MKLFLYSVAAAILVGYGALIGVGKASMGGGKEGEEKWRTCT